MRNKRGLLAVALTVGALFASPSFAVDVSTWSEFQTAVNNSNITDISVNENITYESVVQNIARDLSIIGTTTGKFLNGASGLNGFIVDSGGALNINALTMKGFSSDYGGAIYNNGTISITGATDTEGNIVAFEGNTASINGGAINNQKSITSIIGDFKSNSAKRGGAIYSSKLIESITGDFIANHANKGGAIYVDYSSVYIKAIDDNIKFDGNYVTGSTQGGAIYNDGGNNVYLYAADGKSITFTGNTTGLPTEAENVDGIYNVGTLNINGNGTDTYTGTVNLYTVSDQAGGYLGETNIYGGTVNVKDTLTQMTLRLKGGTLNLGRNANVGNLYITDGAKLSLSIPDGTFENYENEINKLTTGFYSGVLSDLTVDYDATAAEGSNMDKIIINGAGSGSVAPNSSIKLTSVNVIKDGNTLNNGIFLTGTPAGTLDNLDDVTETTSTTTSGGYKYTFTPTSKGVVTVTRTAAPTTLAQVIQDETAGDTYSITTNPYTTNEDLGSLAGTGRNFTIYGNGNTIDGTNPAGGKFDGITIGNSSGQEFTLENATMQNFTTAITNKAGATANVNGVTFANNDTDIANNGTLNLSGTNSISTITGTGTTSIIGGTVNANANIEQDIINVKSGATLASNTAGVEIKADDTYGTGNLINDGTINITGANSQFGADHLTNNATINITGANSLLGSAILTNNGTIDTVSLLSNSLNNNGNITTSGGIEAIIQNNEGGSITFNGDNEKIMILTNSGTVNFNGRLDTGNSKIQLTQNAGVMNFSTAAVDSTATHSINTVVLNGGTLNFQNNSIGTMYLNNVTLNNDINLMLDADLAEGSIDSFSIGSFVNNGNHINITGFKILSDADTLITSIEDDFYSAAPDGLIKCDLKNVAGYSPIYKYDIEYGRDFDGDNAFIFTRKGGHEGFNPSILAGEVAAQMGGYLNLIQTYENAFEHMDAYMLMTSKERLAMKMRNRYAAAGTDSNLMTYSPNQTPESQRGMWIKPFASFEKVNLNNGPRVENNTYGTFIGGDSDLIELKHGWDAVFSGHVSYNGSHQNYDGVSVYQNGGTLGGTATFYKNNFFTGLTANVGASVAEASTMYGQDNMTMLLAGIASKTGYNWELAKGRFTIQPSMLISYSFVNTFDFKNAAGVNVHSNPLNAIQLAPGLKFIANLPNGWQPYIGLQMVWNIMDDSKVKANDIWLPETSVDPYFQYGVGVQKRWGERFTGFFQTMIRNGGRTGVALSAGFRWTIGSQGKYNTKGQLPKLKETTIKLGAK